MPFVRIKYELAQWFLRSHEIHEVLNSKPRPNILGSFSRIPPYNYLVCVWYGTTRTHKNSQMLEKFLTPILAPQKRRYDSLEEHQVGDNKNS